MPNDNEDIDRLRADLGVAQLRLKGWQGKYLRFLAKVKQAVDLWRGIQPGVRLSTKPYIDSAIIEFAQVMLELHAETQGTIPDRAADANLSENPAYQEGFNQGFMAGVGSLRGENPRIDRLMDEPSPFEIPPDRPLDVPEDLIEIRKRVDEHQCQLAFHDTVMHALAEAMRPFWGPDRPLDVPKDRRIRLADVTPSDDEARKRVLAELSADAQDLGDDY